MRPDAKIEDVARAHARAVIESASHSHTRTHARRTINDNVHPICMSHTGMYMCRPIAMEALPRHG